jgi:hypothetical protein
VARSAKNAEDLAFLLDMLGLIPQKKEDVLTPKERRRIEKEELDRIRRNAKKSAWEADIAYLTRGFK